MCEVFSDYEVFVGGSSSFDMSPKGVNKYFALKDFAETNGYSLDEILFIGDDYGFIRTHKYAALAGIAGEISHIFALVNQCGVQTAFVQFFYEPFAAIHKPASSQYHKLL